MTSLTPGVEAPDPTAHPDPARAGPGPGQGPAAASRADPSAGARAGPAGASGSAAATSASAPPTPADIAWLAAIGAVKAVVVGLAVDAFVNSHTPRFSGKGMRLRAIGYAGGLLVVPAAWRLVGRPEPYPRALDLAVALPLLADAGGNAVGIYQQAHVDDVIHFANGAILTTVIGAVVSPRAQTPWEAAGVAAAAGTSAAAAWEMVEWVGLKIGAKGMNLSYDDTMADLIETAAGALLGGLVTLLRHPVRLRRMPGRADDPIVATGRHRHG